MRNSEAISYTSKFKIIIVQKGSRIQINEEHASSKKKKKSFRRIRNIFMKLILIYKKITSRKLCFRLTPRDKSSNYVFQSQFTIELRLNCVCRIFRGKKNSCVL